MDVGVVRSNCLRIESDARSDSLDCFANLDLLYFDVIVRSSTFGADGLQAGERLKVEVKGI